MKTPTRLKRCASIAVAGTLLAFAAGQASALNPYTYQSSPNGGIYSTSASFNGVSSPLSTIDIAQPSQINQLVVTAQSFYISIQNEINNGMAALAGALSSQGLSGGMPYPGIVTGTLTASVTGLPSGNLAVNVGGLNYSTTLTASGSYVFGLFRFSCVTTLRLGSINFSLEYNPVSGAITNAAPSFVPDQTTQCDSNFSFLPIIGPAIDNKLASLANGLTSVLSGYSGSLLNIQPQQALFGFVNAISPNTYMVGGVDAGMYLRNNIQYLFTGKQVSLSIAQPASFWAPSLRNNTPGPSQYSGNAFTVNFRDNGVNVAGFNVKLTRYFTWTLVGGGEE
jgi:hypothetical protein